MTKEELIKQAKQEAIARKEEGFKLDVATKIKNIIDYQGEIAQCQKSIEKLQKEIREMEFEPVSKDII